jgi:hypothetical protein
MEDVPRPSLMSNGTCIRLAFFWISALRFELELLDIEKFGKFTTV